MEIFKEREADLTFSWHPGCGMQNGVYFYGAIGRTGPAGATGISSNNNSIIEEVKIPNTLCFTISMRKDDKNLYECISSILGELKKSGDRIDVKYNEPKVIKERGSIKSEHKHLCNSITKQNDYISRRFDKLIGKLIDLGCNLDYVQLTPDYVRIPDDWYEWTESTDYKATFNIGCCKGTKFYDYLNENGFLDKYFPKWYKEGKY